MLATPFGEKRLHHKGTKNTKEAQRRKRESEQRESVHKWTQINTDE
jgi:hypothetical protein